MQIARPLPRLEWRSASPPISNSDIGLEDSGLDLQLHATSTASNLSMWDSNINLAVLLRGKWLSDMIQKYSSLSWEFLRINFRLSRSILLSESESSISGSKFSLPWSTTQLWRNFQQLVVSMSDQHSFIVNIFLSEIGDRVGDLRNCAIVSHLCYGNGK